MAIVLVLELLLRTLGLGRPLLYQADSYVEYLAKPNQKVFRFGKSISTDDLGLRFCEQCRLERNSESTKRSKVMILGDSVMFGGFVDDKSLASNSLERSRKDLIVANVSAGSWGPGNWLGWVQSRGFLNADSLIIVVSSHDAFDEPQFKQLNLNTNPVENPSSALDELSFRYLPKVLPPFLSRRMLSLQEFLNSEDSFVNQNRYKKNYRALPQHVFSGPDLVCSTDGSPLADLKCLILRSRHAGIPVSVVQFWNRDELLSGSPEPGHSLIASQLEDLKIPVIQSKTIFYKCSAGSFNSLFIDHIHPYTDAGQQCLSKTLAYALAALRQ